MTTKGRSSKMALPPVMLGDLELAHPVANRAAGKAVGLEAVGRQPGGPRRRADGSSGERVACECCSALAARKPGVPVDGLRGGLQANGCAFESAALSFSFATRLRFFRPDERQ